MHLAAIRQRASPLRCEMLREELPLLGGKENWLC